MAPPIRYISILICILLVVYVFELVRRKHLNEEYSVGWLVTGSFMLILSIFDGLLKWISDLVGATLFTSTLFFFGLLFLMVICLHFSIRISALTNQVRRLTQHMAILYHQKDELDRVQETTFKERSAELEKF